MTARKRSYVCQSFCSPGRGGLHGCGGGHGWLQGACMVVGGGHVWLQRGMHGLKGMCGCGGACMVAGGMRGCRGCAWLQGGMHGCRGACVVLGGAWLWGTCLVHGDMHGCGGCVWLQRGHAWWQGGSLYDEEGACMVKGSLCAPCEHTNRMTD